MNPHHLQLSLVLSLSLILNAVATVRCVDVNSSSPTPPYTNWATAAVTIQDAVDAAQGGDQILVTNGVYAAGGRAIYGAMTNRVAVYKALTVQSVNGPEFTIIQGHQVPGTTNGDGAIRCVYLTGGASLSGFTLTQGATRRTGDAYYEMGGGALYCAAASSVASNCVLTANSAYNFGGGALFGTLYDCTLSANSADYSAGGAFDSTLVDCALTGNSAGNYGGGASDSSTLKNCILTANSASLGGGAWGCRLTHCTLSGNSANSGGGANYSTLSNCTLTANSAYNGAGTSDTRPYDGGGASGSTLYNCALSGNSTGGGGGGASGCTLYNCTLTGNSAVAGGGAIGGTLNNCIVYYNNATDGPNFYALTLNYCCTTPAPRGSGNITVEPGLASAFHLSADSPCRGAGNAAYASGTDIDGEAWGSPPSIGCDEYHVGAVTGPLAVAMTVSLTNVAVGFPVSFRALIEARAAASLWQFGDGLTATNRPYVTHTWMKPGDFLVALVAFNESNPNGVSATVTVHVTHPIHYVSADSPNPVPPYSSWATAAANIQDAVDAATIPGALVLVTNGVYDSGGRAVYATMTNRVAVYKPVTVRSVNGPEFTTIEGRQVPGTTNGNGAVRCVYLTNGASLFGFTLTNGATRQVGDEQHERKGGGLYCEFTTVVVSNCVLAGNSAADSGGGAQGGTLYNCTLSGNSAVGGGGASSATLYNCVLAGNSAAHSGGGAQGGTLYNCTLSGNSAVAGGGGGASYATLSNCTVSANSAHTFGGGAYSSVLSVCTILGNTAGRGGGGASQSTLSRCVLIGNSAPNGGGVSRAPEYSNTQLPYLDNCLLAANLASLSGGGVYGGTLSNCTVVLNSAAQGGGAYLSTLNNCIAYYNTATNGPNYYAPSNSYYISLNYCCTTPKPAKGLGHITNAPLFANLVGRDFHLQPGSPCINAGNNSYIYITDFLDLDGNPRIVRGLVDMGAYEFQPNQPPKVSCPAAATAECSTPVELTATVSDPDGDALTVLWTINGLLGQTNSFPNSNPLGPVHPVSFSAVLPLGTNVVGVLVTDTATNTAFCSTIVTVVDTTAPVIVSAAASPSVLWPPNHQMVPVTVTAHVTDNCGPADWKIIGVQNNEPASGRGDANTGADWVITGDHTVNLRAERSGTGTGRIFSLIVQATDTSGNLSEAKIVPLTVPKSQGRN